MLGRCKRGDFVGVGAMGKALNIKSQGQTQCLSLCLLSEEQASYGSQLHPQHHVAVYHHDPCNDDEG